MRTIPEKESLTVEFKSDQKRLPDRDLVAAAVCLANTEGGDLYLGVEKDGAITGLHPLHQNLTGLAALIANHTIPPLSVRVESLEVAGQRVARIIVHKSTRLGAVHMRWESDGLVISNPGGFVEGVTLENLLVVEPKPLSKRGLLRKKGERKSSFYIKGRNL